MILCDVDNITEGFVRPSPQVIQEEWRRQMQALKDLRRRLREVAEQRAFAAVRRDG